MPKELICTAPQTLQWRAYEERPLAGGEVLIVAEAVAAKHGTEIALYKGYYDRGGYDASLGMFTRSLSPEWKYPHRMGNMLVGRVSQVAGDAGGLAVGDRVLTFGSFRPTHIRKPAACWKMPPNLAWQDAVCMDPAHFAFSAMRDGDLRIGDAVAVFGLGAIGLMLVQLCRAAGASHVIALDPLPRRRELAARMGATLTLDARGGDEPVAAIRRATGGRGVDVAIDFSGNVHALQACLRAVAYGGNVVAGAYPAPYGPGLDFGAEPHRHRVNLMFSRGCSMPDRDHPRWDERRMQDVCFDMIAAGTLVGREMVSVIDESQLVEEYARIAAGTSEHVKIAVVYKGHA